MVVLGWQWTSWKARCDGYHGSDVVNPSSISVNQGDVVEFRGDNSTYGAYPRFDGSTFQQSTAVFDVSGNIMSLIDPENFYRLTELDTPSTFSNLFRRCYGLRDASNLLLPALKLSPGCYGNMFVSCTGMTACPDLPATELADQCYYSMFNGCRSLTTAPALPATKLKPECYYYMFSGCYNLTTAPALPSTELEDNCYNSMFRSCRSITTAPELPATTLKTGCYNNMFSGCTSLTYLKSLAYNNVSYSTTNNWLANISTVGTLEGYKNPSKPLDWAFNKIETPYLTFNIESNGNIGWKADNGSVTKTIEYSINNGSWVSITSTQAGVTFNVTSGDVVRFRGNNTSYGSSGGSSHFTSTARFSLFGNPMSLVTASGYSDITALTDTYVFSGLFSGCSGLTDASELFMSVNTMSEGCYSAMFKNCTSLKVGPFMNTTTLADYCYESMFEGCTTLTAATFGFGSSYTTTAKYYAKKMFAGCRSLQLPPHGTLEMTKSIRTYYPISEGCYEGMFSGCTSLEIAANLRPTIAKNCFKHMFAGCSSLEIAPKLGVTALTEGCYYGMFENCSKLEYVNCQAVDASATDCLTNWMYNVKPNGTFVKDPSATWTRGGSGVPNSWTIKTPDTDYRSQRVKFHITSAGELRWSQFSSEQSRINIYYKVNGGTEQHVRSVFNGDGSTLMATVSPGDVVEIVYAGEGGGMFYHSTAGFTLSGNLYAFYHGYDEGFETNTYTTPSSFEYGAYTALFLNCHGLTSIDNLILPTKIMSYRCYAQTFAGTSITRAPKLPAKFLDDSCYNTMFANTLITSTPELPATELKRGCYVSMFTGCQYLTTIGNLNATKLADDCYAQMFAGCTSLVNAPSLPATELKQRCYTSMFQDCTNLRNVDSLPATKLPPICYWNMFDGCTSLVNPPAICATTYGYASMREMFEGCTSLTRIPVLDGDMGNQSCYKMFRGCTSLTTVDELPDTTLKSQCYAWMFADCTYLQTAPELPAAKVPYEGYLQMFWSCSTLDNMTVLATDLSTYHPTFCWVIGVSNSGTFAKNSSMTSWTTGDDGIPAGWTVVDAV